MAYRSFVNSSMESADCFRRFVSLKRRFLLFSMKLRATHQACDNIETYRLKLLNKGVNPESDIFRSIKKDQGLITEFLEVVDSHFLKITEEMDLIYRKFLWKGTCSLEEFNESEHTIMGLYDIVSDSERKCMLIRQEIVKSCLEELNPLLSNMLDNSLNMAMDKRNPN